MRASITSTPACLQTLLDVVLELLADLGGVAAQRDLVILAVVGMAGRQVAQRRLGLDGDEVFVVLDLEQRLRGVDHAPDHHRGDLDRVALAIVDLRRLARGAAPGLEHLAVRVLHLRRVERAGLEVADAQRDRALAVERVDPEEAGGAHRPLVLAEQQEDARVVGGDRHEAHQANQEGEQGEDRADQEERGAALDVCFGQLHALHEQERNRDQQREQDEERDPTGQRTVRAFGDHRATSITSRRSGPRDVVVISLLYHDGQAAPRGRRLLGAGQSRVWR